VAILKNKVRGPAVAVLASFNTVLVKQLGLLTNEKQINWSNLKKKTLLVHKEIKIKINAIFNESFYTRYS